MTRQYRMPLTGSVLESDERLRGDPEDVIAPPSITDLFVLVGEPPVGSSVESTVTDIDAETGEATVEIDGPQAWLDSLDAYMNGKRPADVADMVRRIHEVIEGDKVVGWEVREEATDPDRFPPLKRPERSDPEK